MNSTRGLIGSIITTKNVVSCKQYIMHHMISILISLYLPSHMNNQIIMLIK